MTDASQPSLALTPTSDNVYRLDGELSFATAEQALGQGECLDPSGSLKLDLAGLERIDSAGLAVIVEWWRRCREQDGALLLCNVPAQLHKLIAISELQEILAIEE